MRSRELERVCGADVSDAGLQYLKRCELAVMRIRREHGDAALMCHEALDADVQRLEESARLPVTEVDVNRPLPVFPREVEGTSVRTH